MRPQPDDEGASAFTPETCPTCAEPLPPRTKACPDCRLVFTPDAKGAERKFRVDTNEKKSRPTAWSSSELLKIFSGFKSRTPNSPKIMISEGTPGKASQHYYHYYPCSINHRGGGARGL